MRCVDGPQMPDTSLLRVTARKDCGTYSRSSQYPHGGNLRSQTQGMLWGRFGGKDKDRLRDVPAAHEGLKSITRSYRSIHPAISAPNQKQLRDKKDRAPLYYEAARTCARRPCKPRIMSGGQSSRHRGKSRCQADDSVCN
jgi:hypothetical protein